MIVDFKNLKIGKNIGGIFRDCDIFEDALSTLEILNIDTSNTKDASHMFSVLSALKKIHITSFDTSSIKDMSYMF